MALFLPLNIWISTRMILCVDALSSQISERSVHKVEVMEEDQTDHSQQVTSGRQPSIVRNFHTITSQVRQLRVFYSHLQTTAQTKMTNCPECSLSVF